MVTQDVFYGIETTLLQRNVYKVYLKEGKLYFGRIAERVFATFPDEPLYLPKPSERVPASDAIWVNNVRERVKAEQALDASIHDDAKFLSLDKRNSMIAGTDVKVVEIAPIKVPSANKLRFIGKIVVQLVNGKKRKLNIVGVQNAKDIENMIRTVSSDVSGSFS